MQHSPDDLATLFAQHLEVHRTITDGALETCQFESLAIYAGAPHPMFLDDQYYPFRANPHFKLWAPLPNAPGSWIVYRPGKKLRLVFVQPNDYWHQAPSIPNDYWTQHFDIDVIRAPQQAAGLLHDLPRCALIGESDSESSNFAARNPSTLLNYLHFARARKTAYEIECTRRANARAVLGHRAAEEAFHARASEYEIHMTYLHASEQSSEELPYGNIVALNEHAAVLHYQHQERKPPHEHRSLLIDAGAEFAGYAADITRTYASSPSEFAHLIDALDAAQQRLCGLVQPGVQYIDIHLAAHREIATVLYDAGLIRVPAEEAVALGISSVFFPHGIGHLLGLQVHDVGGLMADETGAQSPPPDGHPYLRLTRALEPGFIVTIEPGLYFIDMLLTQAHNSPIAKHIDWQRVDALRPFGGIRIEDDVVCTQAGPRNLTRETMQSHAA